MLKSIITVLVVSAVFNIQLPCDATDVRVGNQLGLQIQAPPGTTGDYVKLQNIVGTHRLQVWTVDWDKLFTEDGTVFKTTEAGGIRLVLDQNKWSGDIVTWADNGGTNQLWQAKQAANHYQIINKYSGKCLSGLSLAGTATVRPCDLKDQSQLWDINPEKTIRNVGTDKYLDSEGTPKSGNPLLLRSWTGSPAQQWTGNYGEALGWGTNFLSDDQVGIADPFYMDEDQGTRVVHTWQENWRDSRKWYLARIGPYFLIKNIESNRCIVPDGNGRIVAVTCNTADTNQHWEINSFVIHLPAEFSEGLPRLLMDSEVAIYGNENIVSSKITWMVPFLRDVWQRTKAVYGMLGPDPYLQVFLRKTPQGGSCTPGVFADSGEKNAIRCDTQYDFSYTGQGYITDGPVHEISHNIENFANGVCFSPSWGLWKDSYWAPIFIYDIYRGIGNATFADKVSKEFEAAVFPTPRPNAQWWTDWWMPIYNQHGGTATLKSYFQLLAVNLPKKGNCYNYQLNWGEFVHFWSGAANFNLKPYATKAFGWPAEWEMQFAKAKVDFPAIKF